jgi:hypothetical protein
MASSATPVGPDGTLPNVYRTARAALAAGVEQLEATIDAEENEVQGHHDYSLEIETVILED